MVRLNLSEFQSRALELIRKQGGTARLHRTYEGCHIFGLDGNRLVVSPWPGKLVACVKPATLRSLMNKGYLVLGDRGTCYYLTNLPAVINQPVTER